MQRGSWIVPAALAAAVLCLAWTQMPAAPASAEDRGESCRSDADCPSGHTCLKEFGDCDGIGFCYEPPPPGTVFCPAVYDPVCGCDGITYGNACYAGLDGASIAHAGACAADNGDVCTSDAQCEEGQFCKKEDGDCAGAGVCTPITGGPCPDIWEPVCGCDGNTYSNACYAHELFGVNIAHDGKCGDEPACTSNQDCPDGQYCGLPVGECDGTGTCLPMPEICPMVYAPVCGCDGQTHGNSCLAAGAGVSIAHDGPCVDAVVCETNADCEADLYCGKEVGDCDGIGTCLPMPEFCPLVYEPVCGCDGQTHGNPCLAAGAGVSIAHDGPCVDAVVCETNADCEADLYCGKEVGDCDGIGTCLPMPEFCPLVYAPVCGCDGVTYDNACFAAGAGVSVDHDGHCLPACPGDVNGDGSVNVDDLLVLLAEWGDCPSAPFPCPADLDGDGLVNVDDLLILLANWGPCPGCLTNADCDEGLYCATAVGDCDGEGVCEPMPLACPDVWDPVCGCDGETHSNACFAAAAGVGVEHEGKCGDDGAAAGACCFFTNCQDGATAEECDAASGVFLGPGTDCMGIDSPNCPMDAWCAGHCGEQSPVGCWCDEACVILDDCCDDVCTTCGICGAGT